MAEQNIFLYRSNCSLCYQALQQVLPLLAEAEVPVVLRKITPEYSHVISGVPALILRRSAFRTEQDIIILGSHMKSALLTLINNIL